MSNRGWLLAAVLLVSGGPLAGQEGKESPIGAWVTNVDEPTGPGPPRNVQADSGDRQVRAHNRVGCGEPDSVAAAPANEPPKCTGPETKRLAENGSRQIGTYTCTDPGDAITWILKGAQADSLELRPLSPPQAARRTLAFRNIPNYELRSRYDAWVIGRDRGGLSDTVEVTVTVTDSLDEGVVTVSNPSPRVAEWITAELDDEDGGVENTLWTWPRTTPGGASDDGDQGQADASNRYYVPRAALGKQLQARVSYDDDYAEENTAISDKTQPVRANVPGAPLSLQATPGHRQVHLRWTPAATRGAAIDSYEVHVDEGRWSTVPGLGAARDTTITGLTNGTSYTFEVRAHNHVGAGAAASAEVAPAGGPGPATLAAGPGDRQAPNGAEVKLYRYRYRSASGWTGRDWHRVAGKGAARDTTLTGLSNGTLYTFELRAKTGRAAASPTRRPPSR